MLYNLCVGLTTLSNEGDNRRVASIVAQPTLSPADTSNLTALVSPIRHLLLSTAHTHLHTQQMHRYLFSPRICFRELVVLLLFCIIECNHYHVPSCCGALDGLPL